MKVETYEIEPESTEIAQLAADGEARELCEKLGLEGQLSLGNNESQTIFPYRRMTMIEQRVYEFHCPMRSEIKSYKSDAIPVRVLQVAAHAHDCNFLKKMYVWHPEDAKLDPVLVGYSGTYDSELYILARWGAVWKDFATLLKEAKAGWAALRKARLDKAVKEITAYRDSVAQDAELYFAGKGVETSTYF